jgi:diguanylate cyclase (GGDEF)-like protein/excisionase family DNA binding protein/PAS domain S-box-containing protein
MAEKTTDALAGPATQGAAIPVVTVSQDPADAAWARDLLKNPALAVIPAVSAVEAVGVIPTAGVPVCVLLDIPSFGADFVAQLAELSRFAPHAPLIALGEEGRAARAKAIEAGATDYLVKRDLTGETLSRAVAVALARSGPANAHLGPALCFQVAFEDSSVAIALLSVGTHHGGAVRAANPAFAALVKRPLDVVLAGGIAGLVHPDDIGPLMVAMEAVATGQSSGSGSTVVRVADGGQSITCAVGTGLIRDADGAPECILATFHDVAAEASHDIEVRRALDALASYGSATLDPAGSYRAVNEKHAATLGHTSQSVIGRSWHAGIAEADRQAVQAALARAAIFGTAHLLARGLRADGSTFDAEIDLVANFDRDGALSDVEYYQREVSPRARQRREDAGTSGTRAVTGLGSDGGPGATLLTISGGDPLDASVRDPLTGLPNRASLVEQIGRALARASASHKTVGLFLVGIDAFEDTIDSLGHSAGEIVLLAFGSRLQAALPDGDILARVANDELAVLSPDLTPRRDSANIAETLSAALASPIEIEGSLISLTASIGVARSHDGACAEDLLRDAHTAMHQAKRNHRGSYEIFNGAMRAELLRRLVIERELLNGLRAGQLTLAYQPIVTVAEGTIAGAEALARWESPSLGHIAPAEFIAVAERAGSIVELDDYVLRLACQTLASWSAAEQSPLSSATMWVNLSGRQLDDPAFPERVRRVLADTGADGSRLFLELTERAFVDLATGTAAGVIDKLRMLGIRLALDDFGTGESALTRVSLLPISAVKLDPTFVSRFPDDPGSAAVATAIFAMARSLAVVALAEGVETPEQLGALAVHGCDLAQGFLFGYPMSPAELLEWAASDKTAGYSGQAKAPPRSSVVRVAEAAAQLGVSESTIRRWADSGRLGTVRTSGAHRRILVADVAREARRGTPPVKLKSATPPEMPMPHLAALLDSRGDMIVEESAAAIYAHPAGGWFSASGSLEARGLWLAALAQGARTGSYDEAMKASAGFFRTAVLAGTTILERHLLIQRFGARMGFLLRSAGAELPEVVGTLSLMNAVKHQELNLA